MMNLFRNIATWILVAVFVVGPWILLSPETFGERVIAFFISWIWLAVFMTWGWARFRQNAPKCLPKVTIPDTFEGPEDISGYG